MRKFMIISLCLAVSLLFVAGAIFVKVYVDVFVNTDDSQVVLLNRASEPIARGRLLVLSRTYVFQKIPVGEKIVVAFPVHREGGFTVDVEFLSGKKLTSNEMGYVAPGAALKFLVEIHDGKIKFSDSQPGMGQDIKEK